MLRNRCHGNSKSINTCETENENLSQELVFVFALISAESDMVYIKRGSVCKEIAKGPQQSAFILTNVPF